MSDEKDLVSRLRWFNTNVQSDSPLIPPMQRLAVESADEIERLRADLKNIATQKTTEEMDEQENEDADFVGGYDALIHIARRALQPIT